MDWVGGKGEKKEGYIDRNKDGWRWMRGWMDELMKPVQVKEEKV